MGKLPCLNKGRQIEKSIKFFCGICPQTHFKLAMPKNTKFRPVSSQINRMLLYWYIPGCRTLSTLGLFSRNIATAKPFFICSLILKCKVFSPLLTKKQSNGLGTGPIAKKKEKINILLLKISYVFI